MWRFAYSLNLFLICCTCSLAQTGSLRFRDSLKVKATTVAMDQMNRLYLLTSNGSRLIRYKEDLILDRELGSPFFSPYMSLDVSEPGRLLLFYPEYSSVQILDENLETMSDEYYPELNSESAFCHHGTGQYAYFSNGKIHTRDQKDKSIRSGEVIHRTLRKTDKTIQLKSDQTSLYLLIPGSGLWIFNEQLKSVHHLEDSAILKTDVRDGLLYYLKDNAIYLWKPGGQSYLKIYQGTETISDFALNQKYLVICLPGRVLRFERKN